MRTGELKDERRQQRGELGRSDVPPNVWRPGCTCMATSLRMSGLPRRLSLLPVPWVSQLPAVELERSLQKE